VSSESSSAYLALNTPGPGVHWARFSARVFVDRAPRPEVQYQLTSAPTPPTDPVPGPEVHWVPALPSAHRCTRTRGPLGAPPLQQVTLLHVLLAKRQDQRSIGCFARIGPCKATATSKAGEDSARAERTIAQALQDEGQEGVVEQMRLSAHSYERNEGWLL
jgi:hypothetical protein